MFCPKCNFLYINLLHKNNITIARNKWDMVEIIYYWFDYWFYHSASDCDWTAVTSVLSAPAWPGVRWPELAAGEWLASSGGVGCLMPCYWLWPDPFRCVLWNRPLSPATKPFSIARRDWRLYSSLVRRALHFISSSAALERCTVGSGEEFE